MTAGITIALSCYAFTTSKDYTVNGGMLFVACNLIIIIFLIYFLNFIYHSIWTNFIRTYCYFKWNIILVQCLFMAECDYLWNVFSL